jgi:hypothetical protein
MLLKTRFVYDLARVKYIPIWEARALDDGFIRKVKDYFF